MIELVPENTASTTRYTHVHHVPHAEHVERLDKMAKLSRDDLEDFEDVSGTPCCPPPVPFTGQCHRRCLSSKSSLYRELQRTKRGTYAAGYVNYT